MLRIEALAIAIAREYQALEPGSEACQTLNPGLLRRKQTPSQSSYPVNENRIRIFTSLQAGYRALIDNLMAKCSGREEAVHTLADLCRTFPFINTRNIMESLRDALNDDAIDSRTPIAFFLQDKP